MPSFTRPFSEIGKADADKAGGKGASLGEMTQAGIPIPPGFVVLASAFERFLEEADLNQELDTIFHTVNHEEMRTVELASERVQKLIVEAKMPEDIAREITDEFTKLGAEYVAVRSSATAEDSSSAAWAGQLDTFLNTTQDTLLSNVQRCWASLFTPRAIFYRFEKGMHGQKISVAVVVQKMVQSEISGIAFSVHPVTEDRNQLIIEAGFGLGEAIVSGQITPDSYVVEKTPRRIIDTNITTQTRALHRSPSGGNEWRDLTDAEGAKPALSTEQTLKLAELILTIERHYGFPCDIEWAFEAGSFYITQSRPVTTLSVAAEEQKQPKYVFEKVMTRDNGLILQEIWDKAYAKDYFGETNPYLPSQVNHLVDGVVEIWDNKNAIAWFEDQLQRKYAETPTFFDSEMEKHLSIATKVKAYDNKQHLDSIAELRSLISLLVDGTYGFIIFYHALKDERTPAAIRRHAKEIRDKDSFYDNIERLIKSTLEHCYPHTEDVSIGMLLSELDNPPSREVLLERFANCVMVVGEELFLGDLQSYARLHPQFEFDVHEVTDMAELRGIVAYRGAVRGVVRILKRRNQVSELHDGEILVSPETTPDFMPAIRKAAAIVTDEGGAICHAAIISRELRKPCIIGTKIATQVLKNGDLVEVDADKGVVRILENDSVRQSPGKNPS